MATQQPEHTPLRKFRLPTPTWEAYGSVCARLSRERSEDLVAHIAALIREHGTPEEIALLEQGEAETAARRARMHQGRPPKNAPKD